MAVVVVVVVGSGMVVVCDLVSNRLFDNDCILTVFTLPIPLCIN